MRKIELFIGPVVIGFALLLPGCSSCSGGNPAGDAGDASTDTDSDTDTHFEFDGGPTTPCANAPLDDEVCIPGGRFLMGCMPQDTECEDVEKPMHEVTLSPFFIDRKETTWAPFIDFLNTLRDGYNRLPEGVTVDIEPEPTVPVIVWANPRSGGSPEGYLLYPIRLNDAGDYEWGVPEDEYGDYYDNYNSWAYYLQEDASVGGVTQLGAKLYCESRGKRLATEAQWEYAARGQSTQIYPGPCGDEMNCSWAEYGKCSSECGYIYQSCAPLQDMYLNHCPSVWGVERLAGNAAEWVADELAGDYSGCADGCVDPEPMQGGNDICKGGSIGSSSKLLRISNRAAGDFNWSSTAGIRCARDDKPFALPDGGADGGK